MHWRNKKSKCKYFVTKEVCFMLTMFTVFYVEEYLEIIVKEAMQEVMMWYLPS